jgi:hypothetical protein
VSENPAVPGNVLVPGALIARLVMRYERLQQFRIAGVPQILITRENELIERTVKEITLYARDNDLLPEWMRQ